MTIAVLTAGSGMDDFVGRLERLHGPVTVVRRCQEVAELLAACQTGIARAAIVTDAVADQLTAALVERMKDAEVAVVALSASEQERHRLQNIGAVSAPLDISTEALAETVRNAVDQLLGQQPLPGAAHSHSYADPAKSLASRQQDAGRQRDTDPEPYGAAQAGQNRGQILAIWGPTGAPGRTTLALNLAAELAAAGHRTILGDIDTYGASIAPALGLLDESAGIAQACRLADQGLLDPAALARITSDVAIAGGRLTVLTGITRPDRWPELRTAALTSVLDSCRQFARYTVLDCGFSLEADEELSFDTQAPRRNGATLRSLEMADIVYAIGAADAIGVPRMVRSLAELRAAVPSATPRVVFNRVRPSAIGRFPQRQLAEAWERYGPGTPITACLPLDAAAADAALISGSSLVEAAPQSPLRAAVAELAHDDGGRRRRAGGTRTAGNGRAAGKVNFSRRAVSLLARGQQ